MGLSWRSGNLHIWTTVLERTGDKTRSHRHAFGHTTIGMVGSMMIRLVAPDGRESFSVLNAPGELFVPAGHWHELEALSDGATYWCVFSDPDPMNSADPDA